MRSSIYKSLFIWCIRENTTCSFRPLKPVTRNLNMQLLKFSLMILGALQVVGAGKCISLEEDLIKHAILCQNVADYGQFPNVLCEGPLDCGRAFGIGDPQTTPHCGDGKNVCSRFYGQVAKSRIYAFEGFEDCHGSINCPGYDGPPNDDNEYVL
jgi:hypothetical protein